MIATVDAKREGRWWVLQCREVPGAISQVARLDQAADTIREAIAWVAQVPEDDIQITVVPQLPASAGEHVAAAKRLREQAAEANSQSARESRLAALDLAAAGLSVRDVGQVLGVSYQRVQQLVTAGRAERYRTVDITEDLRAEIQAPVVDPQPETALIK